MIACFIKICGNPRPNRPIFSLPLILSFPSSPSVPRPARSHKNKALTNFLLHFVDGNVHLEVAVNEAMESVGLKFPSRAPSGSFRRGGGLRDIKHSRQS